MINEKNELHGQTSKAITLVYKRRASTYHFNGTAEGDLSVTLGEVHVSHAQLGAWHKDRKVDGASTREVLDVTVSTILASRNRSGRFGCHLVPGFIFALHRLEVSKLTKHGAFWFRKTSQRTSGKASTEGLFLRSTFFGAQGSFAFVPHFEELVAGRRANQTRVNQTSETNTWNVTTRAVDTFNVPDGLGSSRIVIRQELAETRTNVMSDVLYLITTAITFRSAYTTTIFLGKGASESPFVAVERTQRQEFDFQQVSWLGCRDFNGSRKVMPVISNAMI